MEKPIFKLSFEQMSDLRALGVKLCYLHGSAVSGEMRAESDIDIAVLFEKVPNSVLDTLELIRKIVQPLAEDRSLDVMILNVASPLAAQRVAYEGEILFEEHEDARIMFEFEALKRYESTRFFAELGRKALLDNVLEYDTAN